MTPDGARWTAGVVPRLASKVRLRWDAARDKPILLYPEGVLVLNPTAYAVLQLCDGSHTLGQIVRELAARFDAEMQGPGNGVAASPAAGDAQGAYAGRSGRPDHPVSVQTIETDSADPRIQAEAEETERRADAQVASAGDPAQASPGDPAQDREARVRADVVAFLERIDQRGWLEAAEAGDGLGKEGP